jgi:hypothetical protein
MVLQMRKTYGAISDKDIIAYEAARAIRLPEEYRLFMLRNNGGYAANSRCRVPGLQNSIVVLDHIHGLGDMPSNLAEVNEDLEELLPPGFLLWATDPGGSGFLIGLCETEREGQIFYWLHDEDPDEGSACFFLASSFDEFVEGLFSER